MSSPSYNSNNSDSYNSIDTYNDSNEGAPYNGGNEGAPYNGGNKGAPYNGGNEGPSYNSGNASYNESPSYNEEFSNLSVGGINTDLILKSIFYGAIFYLLSLPEVYKMTSGIVGKKVDGVLLHGVVFAILYYILTHFI